MTNLALLEGRLALAPEDDPERPGSRLMLTVRHGDRVDVIPIYIDADTITEFADDIPTGTSVRIAGRIQRNPHRGNVEVYANAITEVTR